MRRFRKPIKGQLFRRFESSRLRQNMYKEHPCFKTPDDETPIWRYMDFSKFVSLLDSSSLFFPSALTLAAIDPYEGSYAKGNIEYDPNKDPYLKMEKPEVIDMIKQASKRSRSFVKENVRKGTYINSWYINDYDSAAMWKYYADSKDGIAIVSTVGRFKRAMESFPKEVYIGEVAYIDYETSTIPGGNLFFPFVHKRKSFEHERELRAVFWDSSFFEATSNLPVGFSVPVDTKELITRVVTSPTSSEWINKLVTAVSKKYGFDFNIDVSSLQQEGLW